MRILLLAGTTEARALALALAAAGRDAVASLAGATQAPKPLPLPTRIGGFGGADGFRKCLEDGGFGAVLDATHPFAAQISARSASVCAELGMPYVQLLRPEWTPGPGDCWTQIEGLDGAATVIPSAATVFVATGRQSVADLNLPGRTLHIRVIDPPDGAFPFAKGGFVVQRAPFEDAGEIALFRRLKIDWLLTKNAGGAAGAPKLAAARALGLPVAMVRRPPAAGPVVETVADAVAWVEGLS